MFKRTKLDNGVRIVYDRFLRKVGFHRYMGWNRFKTERKQRCVSFLELLSRELKTGRQGK